MDQLGGEEVEAGSELGQAEAEVEFDLGGGALAEQLEEGAEAGGALVLDQASFGDSGEAEGALEGGGEVAQFIDQPEVPGVTTGEQSAVGELGPGVGQGAALVAGGTWVILVAGESEAAALVDGGTEALVGRVDQVLDDAAFLGGDILFAFTGAEHVLEGAAFEDHGFDADLIHHAAPIVGLHDDSDAAGDGQFVGDDPAGGGSDVIAAGGGHGAHGNDDGFLVGFLEYGEALIDFVGGEHFAAWGIDFDDDGFHQGILTGTCQLVVDVTDQIIAAIIHGGATDDSLDFDQGDFLSGGGGFDDDFAQAIGVGGGESAGTGEVGADAADHPDGEGHADEEEESSRQSQAPEPASASPGGRWRGGGSVGHGGKRGWRGWWQSGREGGWGEGWDGRRRGGRGEGSVGGRRGEAGGGLWRRGWRGGWLGIVRTISVVHGGQASVPWIGVKGAPLFSRGVGVRVGGRGGRGGRG